LGKETTVCLAFLGDLKEREREVIDEPSVRETPVARAYACRSVYTTRVISPLSEESHQLPTARGGNK